MFCFAGDSQCDSLEYARLADSFNNGRDGDRVFGGQREDAATDASRRRSVSMVCLVDGVFNQCCRSDCSFAVVGELPGLERPGVVTELVT
jgi:hypothetical protein